MILGDVDCSVSVVWGHCSPRLRVLLQALEVDCPQFMATEGYLANGDQLWIS